jgi:hypothetical protein
MARGAWGKVKPEKPPEAALFSLQQGGAAHRQQLLLLELQPSQKVSHNVDCCLLDVFACCRM